MRKILNIGSINIDYVYGVERFVRPGETISAASLEVFPGGKGLNQSIAMARAGGRVYHSGRTGADGLGMIGAMERSGVDVSFVDRTGSATGHAVIQVSASGENCIILYAGANREIGRPLIDRALSGFAEGDFLVLQNEINDIGYIMESASRRGLVIAFNLAPFGNEIMNYPLCLADYLLVNETEGQGVSGKSEPWEILDAMAGMFPRSAVALTLGPDGVVYRDASRALSHGVYDVPVVDTTAAGDTFTGYFITALADEKPVEEALRLASAASALAVSRKGASSSVPELWEVLSVSSSPPR
jgi:ribokinase